jgi:hypothetical protein
LFSTLAVDATLDKAMKDYQTHRAQASGAWGDFVGAINENLNNSRFYSSLNKRVAHILRDHTLPILGLPIPIISLFCVGHIFQCTSINCCESIDIVTHSRISKWKRTESGNVLGGGVHQDVITYADPQSRLNVICEISQYPKSHASELLLRLKNRGSQDMNSCEGLPS